MMEHNANFKTWLENDELDDFYRDNEQKVLNNPEIRSQLHTQFRAKDPDIRKILGVNSEDPRGNYFVRTFNQRHGDWEKSLRVPMQYTPETPKETQIPKETLLWFQDSKITDEDGKPKIVHHGTNEKFDKFEAGEFGFHFGDENAANMMGDTGKYLLKITNPLRLRDLGTWEPERVLKEIINRFGIPAKTVQKILKDTRKLGRNPDLGQDDDMVLNRKAHYEWSRPVRELIKSLGYDGIVYRNEAEGFADSYIAFDNDQIRRIG